MENIWEVLSVYDLIRLIKSNPKKFIIVGLVLKETPASKKKLIKRFLKTKHREYPNLMFLYYQADDKDLGKNISLLKRDKGEYPYIYHLYDSNVLVHVNNVDDITIHESFGEVKHYYEKDRDRDPDRDPDRDRDSDDSTISVSENSSEKKATADSVAESAGGSDPNIEDLQKKCRELELDLLNDIKTRKRDDE